MKDFFRKCETSRVTKQKNKAKINDEFQKVFSNG